MAKMTLTKQKNLLDDGKQKFKFRTQVTQPVNETDKDCCITPITLLFFTLLTNFSKLIKNTMVVKLYNIHQNRFYFYVIYI